MNIKILFFAPAILLMSNCKTQTKSEPQKSDGIMTLGVNKKAIIPQSKISIEFTQIAEDSRCPIDVTCVWEGIAVADLTIKNGTESKQIQLATRDFQPKNVTKSIIYEGYEISLQEIKPYPGKTQENQSVTLKFKQND